MDSLLITTFAAYVVAALHSVLAFVNKRRALERVAFYSLAFGFTLHTAFLIKDGIENGHCPLFGLRETILFIAWALVVTYCLLHYRYHIAALGSFILPIVTLLTLAAIFIEPSNAQPQNILNNDTTWLPVHTALWVFAYTSLFVVFVTSIMYLLQEHELKAKTFSALFHRLPSLTTVNDIASTATSIGFALLTSGIITGLFLSSQRDGRLWHNDPKEILAFLTWLLYLVLILYRSSKNLHRNKAAWLGIAGFAFVLCTFLGARLLGSFHVFG